MNTTRRHRFLLPLIATALFACGDNTPLDPAQFDLWGTWNGILRSTAGAGDISEFRLTIEGSADGSVEEYEGEVLLTFSTGFLRYDQVEADFDTGAGTIRVAIRDFTSPFGFMDGSYDGTTLAIADSQVCRCEVMLTRTP